MYLTKLVLNPERYEVRRDLSDCYQMHRTILSMFPKVPTDTLPYGMRKYYGILFRVESVENGIQGSPYVLLQSKVEPLVKLLPANYLLEEARINSLEFLSTMIKEDSLCRFRLQANPTIKKQVEGKPNGIRVSLVNTDNQLDWLLRKGTLHGFEIVRSSGFLQLQIKNAHTTKGQKTNGHRHSLSFYSVLFEGLLRVDNVKQFSETLETGIGSGKAFGFGLLSLIPLHKK